ncbi:GNAT family N-acetyltransferase [Maribacter sp. 2-571]|uniref:GNAT family N-acetyltransferase n=1 Tax=Maribacter sp. 2-571 TaxID=3417569 RepID=UPI003D335D8F
MKNANVRIVGYEEVYADAFARLNIEWLERYFYVEDYDRNVLENPKEHILEPGGYIFFALAGTEVVGTVALIHRGNLGFELSKMAVTDTFQGLRIGQKLMYHCIDFAGKNNLKRLFLDSNTLLKPAIKLYQKVGFKEIAIPEKLQYARCNIRMELNV